MEGVCDVHEFHVWQLSGSRIIATAHIRCQSLLQYDRIADQVKALFHREGIHSTTIQPEFVEVRLPTDAVINQLPDQYYLNIYSTDLRQICTVDSRPISSGVLDRGAEGVEMRSAEGAENETTKASRGVENGEGAFPSPNRLEGLGKRFYCVLSMSERLSLQRLCW